MSDEAKVKVRFATDEDVKTDKSRIPVNSPTLEIGQGDYIRKFDAKDQPFEATKEEAEMLLRTKHFVRADVSEPRAVATGSGNTAETTNTTNTIAKPPLKAEGKIGGAPAESVSGEQ